MKKALDYNGDSESFKELDLLLSSTSALGEGFLEPIRTIMYNSYHVDKPGTKKAVKKRLEDFYDTFTNKIILFSPVFMSTVYALLDKGIEEQCKIYPLKESA